MNPPLGEREAGRHRGERRRAVVDADVDPARAGLVDEEAGRAALQAALVDLEAVRLVRRRRGVRDVDVLVAVVVDVDEVDVAARVLDVRVLRARLVDEHADRAALQAALVDPQAVAVVAAVPAVGEDRVEVAVVVDVREVDVLGGRVVEGIALRNLVRGPRGRSGRRRRARAARPSGRTGTRTGASRSVSWIPPAGADGAQPRVSRLGARDRLARGCASFRAPCAAGGPRTGPRPPRFPERRSIRRAHSRAGQQRLPGLPSRPAFGCKRSLGVHMDAADFEGSPSRAGPRAGTRASRGRRRSWPPRRSKRPGPWY